MKLNLKKLLCLLLILCFPTLATMPKVFADIDEPKNQQLPSARKRIIKRFTEEQFDKIINAVIWYINKGYEIDWEEIGYELDRTANSCKYKFFTAFGNEQWTPEKDKLLLNLFNGFGNDFSKINRCFSGKTRINVSDRLTYLCNIGTEKNTKKWFTKEQDKKLISLVGEGLTTWEQIKKEMKMIGCSAKECEDRWIYWFCPGPSQKHWTPREDNLILNLYAEVGNQWTVFSKLLRTKTPEQIRSRCMILGERVERLKSRFESTDSNTAQIQNAFSDSDNLFALDDLD